MDFGAYLASSSEGSDEEGQGEWSNGCSQEEAGGEKREIQQYKVQNW